MFGKIGPYLLSAFAADIALSTPLHLELFSSKVAEETGARCLDGSPAGYYLREQDPYRWVIFLEGGGLCLTAVDCVVRAKTTARGSSRFWKEDKTPENNHMLTELSPLNPFETWSHVYVPYCSGDTWLGTSRDVHAVGDYMMSGHLILDAVLETLAKTTSFDSSLEVVMAGTSAGAIGVFQQLDWFADKVRSLSSAPSPPRVTGFPVEGLFFPKHFPVLFPEFLLGLHHALDNTMVDYVAWLFRPAKLHEGCREAAQREGFKEAHCFDASVVFPYIKTPMFILTNQFDKLMVTALGTCPWCSAKARPGSMTGRFLSYFSECMNETFAVFQKAQSNVGLFATNEFHHDENFPPFFRDKERKIQGLSLRAAIERWYHLGLETFLVEAPCGGGIRHGKEEALPCDSPAHNDEGGEEEQQQQQQLLRRLQVPQGDLHV
mmetsp:Transcript_90716/g.189623  ORF Transcript_90716/g.189623 Transcript_90716/m.189623 type:complete len:434 (-) Transcript_90716:361-1662(-)|eukprot:CAMPEP_0206483820 /NCGR_PEP_ID=MMETSP0324_2-20121206/39643_1 /ASSEMBLY_ACC=CAM_ASM_000836 /TAXON_ID=2866 /ORGANISM="Crypthecodinium cohnii, Strain Seligo" /LENGTH=433 /DNA_ID=CAMNT_0053961923 /DNA_START=80 /DNA_END=1381 /DNA_ORIENTATION=+